LLAHHRHALGLSRCRTPDRHGRAGTGDRRSARRRRLSRRAGDQPGAGGMSGAPGPVLSLRGVATQPNGVSALTGLDLDIHPGEVVALLGANGSGKTAVLRAVLGLASVTAGMVDFRGASLADIPVEQRARLGIAYVPEGRRVFPSMSVYDN